MAHREFSLQNPFERSTFLYHLQSMYEPGNLVRIARRLSLLRLALAIVFGLFFISQAAGSALSAASRTWLLSFAAYSGAVAVLRWFLPELHRRLDHFFLFLDLCFMASAEVSLGQFPLLYQSLFIFALFEAAYARGFVESLTTIAAAGFFLLAAKGLAGGSLGAAVSALRHFTSAGLTSTILMALQGVLIGYLAGSVKQNRVENDIIHQAMSGFNTGGSLTVGLQSFCWHLHRIFGTPTILIAAREHESGISFLWRAELDTDGDCFIDLTELEPEQAETYFFEPPAQTWYGAGKGEMQGSGFRCYWPVHGDLTLRSGMLALPWTLLARHPFSSVLSHVESSGRHLDIRFFMLGPASVAGGAAGILFLRHLALRAAPALVSSYVARRVSSQAAKIERESLARDLHDGVIQSMIAIEMQMAALSRGRPARESGLADQLGGIRENLHREIRSMRSLMQRLKHLELGSAEFLQALESTAIQHRSDTRMDTHFWSDVSAVMLPPRICGEVVRILQEALVNVRKHSAASQVRIRFEDHGGGYRLTVSDNGSGFDFDGRMDLEKLDADGKGPRILKERVRMVGGNLEIESVPGKGSSLTILIPRRQHGAY
jgi:signal transduction histidine kinase